MGKLDNNGNQQVHKKIQKNSVEMESWTCQAGKVAGKMHNSVLIKMNQNFTLDMTNKYC